MARTGDDDAPGPRAAEICAELRAIADEMADPELRARLRRATERLEGAGAVSSACPSPTVSPMPIVGLSPRELDVVREIATGATNIQAAQRLSLLPETVKAYLRSASRKLGVRGRYRVVLEARSRGLIG